MRSSKLRSGRLSGSDRGRVGAVSVALAALVFAVAGLTACSNGDSQSAAPRPIPTVSGPAATAGCTGTGKATAPTKQQAAKILLRAIIAGNQHVACSLAGPKTRIDPATEKRVRAAFPHGLTDNLAFQASMQYPDMGGVYVLRRGRPILGVGVVMHAESNSKWWATSVKFTDCVPPQGYGRCVNDTGR